MKSQCTELNDNNKPLLICLSCTRNYGWVTRAFLEINTRWADYVIIVDQMSTDGTRDMYKDYDNVIVVDDTDLTYHEGKRCKMAIDRAREISGDKILVYLDIDEVMPANFQETVGWNQILNSKKGEMFYLQWANLMPDGIHYFKDKEFWMYRVFHDNGKEYSSMGHEMHVPLLPDTYPQYQYYNIDDFKILHFGFYNKNWLTYKNMFYQMEDMDQRRQNTLVSNIRFYTEIPIQNKFIYPIKKEWLYNDVDIFKLVDVKQIPFFADYIIDKIKSSGINKYKKLDIWNEFVLNTLKMQDPRNLSYKILHKYIRCSQKFKNSLFIRFCDKVCKVFYKY